MNEIVEVELFLTTGEYRLVISTGDKKLPERGSYQDFLSYLKEEYYGNEQASDFDAFSMENLRACCLESENKRANVLCYMPKHKAWFEAYAVYSKEPEEFIKVVICDVTKRKEKEEKGRVLLDNALKLAENASRTKAEFLSRMSQDISIPVNSILTMVKTMQENLRDVEVLQNCLKRIENSGQYLLGVFDNLIDMAKIESDDIILERKPICLKNFLVELGEELKAYAQDKMLTFEIVNKAERETREHYFLGDVLRIKQILIKLLMNAFRFTPSGGHVELRVGEEAYANGWSILLFDVRDNGVGIKEEDLDTVFKPFEQGPSIGDNHGVGLGLAICKSLVEMMNGTVRVESEEGRGSCFYVAIPVEIGERFPDEIQPEEGKEEKEPEESKRTRILLADDNLFNAEMTVTILEINGYDVDVAVHGLDAVNKFRNSEENYYKAILMDVQMPICNGIQASHDIRRMQREDAKRIPIIAMSRKKIPEDSPAREGIITDYIAKPVDSSNILSMLEKYCAAE